MPLGVRLVDSDAISVAKFDRAEQARVAHWEEVRFDDVLQEQPAEDAADADERARTKEDIVESHAFRVQRGRGGGWGASKVKVRLTFYLL